MVGKERIAIKKLVTVLVLALALTCGTVVPGYALDLDLSDAQIDADGGGLTVEKIEGPDHFIKESTLEPGTTITRSYVIQNHHAYDYDLFLLAENPISTPAKLDLVNKIDLTLFLDGAEIYSGTVGGGLDEKGRDMENDIHLGLIARESTHRLTAEFSVPGKILGNEYFYAKAEVDWVFRAVCAPDNPKPPLGPTDPEDPPDPVDPKPEGPENPQKPAGPVSPKTGDIASGSLIGAAILAVLIAAYARKRSKDEQV